MAVATVKANGHSPMPPRVRLCGDGCGAEVPADSRFGYLPGHMKRAPKAPKKKRGRPRKDQGRPNPATDLSRVPLQVTEQQLDRFLTRLPFAEKQHLANYHLMQVDLA